MNSHSELLGVRTSTYEFGGDTIKTITVAMTFIRAATEKKKKKSVLYTLIKKKKTYS